MEMSPVRVRDNKRRFYGAQSADERKLRRKTASTGKSSKKDYTKDKSNTGSNKSGGDDKTSSLQDENSYPINSKSSAKKLAELSSDEDLLNESDLEEEFDLLNDNDNGGDVFDPNNCTDGSNNNNKSDDEEEIEEAIVAATAVESDDEVVSPVKRLFVSNTKKRRIIEEDHDESEEEEDATVQLEGEESGEDLMVEVVEGVVTETNGGKSGSSKRGEKNRVDSSKKSTKKVPPSKEAKKHRVSESSDGEGEPPIKKVKPKPTTKKEPNSNKSTVKKFNVSSKKTPISTGGGASSKEIKKKLAHLVGKATNKSLYVQKKLAKAAAATLAAAGEEEDSHASDLDDASVDERYAVGGGGAKGGGSNWEDTSSKTKDSRSRKKLVAMSRSSTSSTNKKREKNSFEFDEVTVAQDDEDMHSSDDEKSGDEESEYHPTQADDLIVGVGVVSRPRRFSSRNQQKENVADDVVVMTEMKTSGKRGGGRRTKKKKKEEEVVVQSEDEDIDVEPSKQKSTRTSHRVKKTAEKELMTEDEDIEEESVHKQKKKRSTTSRRGKKRAVENELMSEDEASDVERRTFRRVKKTAGKELTSNDEDVVEAPRRKRFIPKGEATKSQSTKTKKQPEQPLLSDSGEPTDNEAVAIKGSKKKKLAKNLQLENEESDVEPPKKKSPRDSAVFMKIASKRVSGRQGKKLTDGVLSEVDEHVAVPPSEKAGRCKRTGSSNSKGRGELSDSDGEAGVRTDNGNDEEEDDFWEADGGNDDPFDVFEPEDDISAPKEVVLEKKSGRKRKKNSTSCGRAGLSDIFTQRDPATCSSNSNAEEEEEVEAPANKTKNGDKSKGVEPTGESQSESVKKQEEGNTTSSGNETVDATTFVQFSTRHISEDPEKYRAAVQSQYYQSEGSSSTQSHSNSKAGLSAVISRDEKETRSKHTNDELLGVLVILKEKHEKSREIKKQTNKCAAAWGDSLKQETKLDGEIEVLLAKAHRLAKGRWETTTIM